MNYSELLKIYNSVKEYLTQHQVRYRIIGGQASIQYGFAEFTKDFDIGIELSGVDRVASALDQIFTEDTQIFYRFGLGAPLDARWAAHGWTSHFEIFNADQRARLDIFPALPRLPIGLAFSEGCLDLHVLAETKKTQRVKDWEVVRSAAMQLIDSGEPVGFLHLFDADLLIKLNSRGVRPSSAVVKLRPSLTQIEESSSHLEAALTVERTFWQKWDKFRINSYLGVSKEYYRVVSKNFSDLQKLSIQEQHHFLLDLAEKHLPVDPFVIQPVATIVEKIKEQLALIFPPNYVNYLPNLDQIVHRDGIYNPALKESADEC